MPHWFVGPLPRRPPFGHIVTFLWGEGFDVDSDGDSEPADSQQWTWLQVQNRAKPDEVVNIDMVADDPETYEVGSNLPWLAAAAAYFLAVECDARVRAHDGEGWMSPHALVEAFASFDVDAALSRVRASS